MDWKTAGFASVSPGALGARRCRACVAAPPQIVAGNWQVVLAAGDDGEPVFDNATRAIETRLMAAGVPSANIHRLSASARGDRRRRRACVRR